MGMALKVDVAKACQFAGTEKPVDLVHLSTLTMGDKALEHDVLKMFLAQIPHYIYMIKASQTPDEVYRAAHTIKGAASNIGAFRLANLAGFAEENKHFDMASIMVELSAITEYVAELCSEV